MTRRMLIDATHTEETRVAVMNGNRLEEFDYESKFRKPIKGSIFLAKVTRVEPSLQAAFVNFGGNRHGFLPFAEIHPDYFRIPIADREALIAEQEEALRAHDEEEEEKAKAEEMAASGQAHNHQHDDSNEEISEGEAVDDIMMEEIPGDLNADIIEEENLVDDAEEDDDNSGNRIEEDEPEINGNVDQPEGSQQKDGNNRQHRGRGRGRRGRGRGGRDRQNFRSKRTERYDESGGGNEDNGGGDGKKFRYNLRRKYKIQEVIKRGQIVLVQASKEERGNKGAAFTTYLSLPGRYCVLMPNSPRAGGVSRKIANYQDRARMRELLKELELPQGMSVIVRTAGVERTKAEIKRDLDYLMRLWNNIRELTLESTAPSLVYEEADLIKRAVRDLYTKEIDEIHVSGEEGYNTAKNFMKMMMPSHVKKVEQYTDASVPLFNKYRAESQIAEIGEVQVTLPSGGYLVINPTEALVSIDVNSGRATKERHIEETALKTNLEAAEEVARQLRLRDLGGLVVIDFIDMENRRNNAKVEKKMRDALAGDRARVQAGRISMFGLMELSRQRLSPSLTESQYETCSKCLGLGRTRTADATSIMVLRAIEDEGIKARAAQVIVHVSSPVALYMLNNKRMHLSDLEKRYNFQILIRIDDEVGASSYRLEVSKPAGQSGDQDDAGEEKPQNNNRENNREGGRDRDNARGDRDGNRDNNNRGDREGGREGGRGRRGGRNRNRNRNDNRNDNHNHEADGNSVEAMDDDIAPQIENDNFNDTEEEVFQPAQREERFEAAQAIVEEAPKQEKRQERQEPKMMARRSSTAAQEEKAAAAARAHEKVNEASGEKKKGWWSR